MKYQNLLLASMLAGIPAISQSAIGPIFITPTRTVQTENNSSATVYHLNSNDIKNSGAKTTSELLRGIPGIQIDDLFGNGTETSISVRGFSGTANANSLVLINGRRLNHSDTAAPDLHHIFPKDIERIEVMVGSAGVLYGDQAVGGVINIITKKTGSDNQQVTLQLGSFGYKGLQYSRSQKINDTLAYRFTAETFEADHYRDNNEEENTNFHVVLEYDDADQSAFFEIQKINDELELPGALLEAEFDDDPQQSNAGFVDDFIDEDTTVTSIGYQRHFGRQTFNIDFTRRKIDADVLQSFRNSPSPATGFSNRENNSLNPKLSGTFNVAVETAYVLGIDLEETDYDLSIPNAFGTTTASNEQTNESLFFQLIPQLTEKLQLTFGMRKSSVENDMKDGFSFPDGLENDDDITVAELGLAYRVDEQLRFTARYDENFRFAKVNEIALAEFGTVLDTQTGESLELGVEWNFGTHRIIGSIYRLDLENEIVFDPTVGPDFGFGPTGLNVNLDKTRRDGLTLSVIKQMSNKLSIKTELGLVDAKYKSGTFSGKDISGVASEILKIRGDYQINEKNSTYLEMNHTGERFAQGDNANAFSELNSITVFNAGYTFRPKNWDIHFRINNLTDKKYAEFITNNGFGAAFQSSPERNFSLSASYSF